MRNLLLAIVAFLLLLPLNSDAQIYQLPNGGMEIWDGTGTAEPTGWNSFATSECTLPIGCSSAQQTHHENSSDVRPGSTGTHSCRIYATSIMGVVANGNMTTGRIHAASVTATSSSNYNVSYPSQQGFAQQFNGTPDYINFWAKVHAASSSTEARMNSVIHSNAEVRDPVTSSDYPYISGVATLNFTGDNTWHEYTVPFSYSYGNATPQYILITFTTNKTPGGGSANDELWFDDIEFVYISTLSSLKNNGVNVPNFSANTLNYSIELPYGSAMPTVTATATSVNGVVNITQPTLANPTATIVVTQGPSTTTYTINYTFAARESADLLDILLDSVSIDNYNVSNPFNSNRLTYDVILPIGSILPVVDGILDEPSAQMTITQPTEQNPTATLAVTSGSLAKTYVVNFTIASAITADLADLQLDGITVAGFSPEITQYHTTLLSVSDLPTVTAIPASAAAEVSITQPTSENPVATVVVVCDTLTKTYVVNFSFVPAANAYLQSLMVNGNMVPDFNSFVFDYEYQLPFGTSLTDVRVAATPLSPLAMISPILVDTVTLITVSCGDSMRTYTLAFTFAAEVTADLLDLRVDDVTVPGFSPAVLNYSLIAFGTELPVVTATARSSASVLTISQATVENPTATVLVDCEGLTKTYTVAFTVLEANADLADLQLNGITIEGFDPAITSYEYSINVGSTMPIVSAVAQSDYATVEVEQPTAERMMATVTVTCGDSVKVYTVQITYIGGVEDVELPQVTVYPNPAEDEVNVVVSQAQATELAVYNVAGQQVMSESIKAENTILNINRLQSGLYILYVKDGSSVVGVTKFVKR